MEKINCAYDKLVELNKLVPNPKNNNKHSQDQIKRLAKIIDYQGQRVPIVVSNMSGFIVKGHGRLEALKLLGWEKAAVDYQDYESEAQEYADMTADNEIARWAEFQTDMFLDEIKGFDIDEELFGLQEMPKIEDDETRSFNEEIANDLNDFRGLIYEPQGKKPSISELYTDENMKDFEKRIKDSNATKDEKDFMLKALTRFYKFNFKNIAEYYCHSSDELKELFEELILVIPDGKKLLKNKLLKMDLDIKEEADND